MCTPHAACTWRHGVPPSLSMLPGDGSLNLGGGGGIAFGLVGAGSPSWEAILWCRFARFGGW